MNIKKINKYYTKHINTIEKDKVNQFSHSKDIFLKAKGVYIFTKNNKKILDVSGGIGVLNLGHNHPEIINERIKFQKNSNLEVNKNILAPHTAMLSKKISDVLPKELTMSYFLNSGAEANDAAIKTAYKYHNGKRKIILTSETGFTGRLISTGSVTLNLKNKYPKIFQTQHFKVNDIKKIKKIIEKSIKKNGTINIFAILIEPFNHTTMQPCEYGFLLAIRKICNKYKIILIYDEIYTGWSKTGSLFYFMRYQGVCPDLLTTSKSLGGGKASIAAIVMRSKIFRTAYQNKNDYSLLSSTFNGFGEECVTAIKAIELLSKKKYCNFAKNIEKIIKKNFEKLSTKHVDYKMDIKVCGALSKIYFNNGSVVQKIINNKLSNLEKKKIDALKGVILQASILDELYFKYKIWAFQSVSKIVISPSLIIKDNELNYFFDSLGRILECGPEKIIKTYINRRKK